MDSSQPISNMVELMRSRALENPDFVAYRYLGDGENETARLTFGELDRQARTIGARLQQITKSGDRVIMLYSSGFEPVIGLFGCLYANTVSVPALPVQPNRPPDAFVAMLKDAQAKVVLTTTAEQAIVQPLVESVPGVPPLCWIATDALDPSLAEEWRMPEILPESPFAIMYTSGSTGAPRGVFSLHETLSTVVNLSMSMELRFGLAPRLGSPLSWERLDGCRACAPDVSCLAFLDAADRGHGKSASFAKSDFQVPNYLMRRTQLYLSVLR